jgi:hypothetical protein
MASNAEQDLSTGNYRAVVPITALSMATPKRDATNSVLTALLEMVTLTDQTGAAVGTSGNPLYVSGGTGGSTAPYQATPLGYQQITPLTTASGLTVPATATFAIISVEGSNVRWRDDGTAPTATVGMPMYAGSAPQVFSGNLATAQFISTSTPSTLDIAYYR